MSKKGMLIVVSAPSGCGKGTVLAEILKDKERFYYSVSATTRNPREGEKDGVHYHFMSREDFEMNISEGNMLEYAQYCGNYYGTPKKKTEEKLAEGKNVILEIEVQGAMKIKQSCPEAVFIFIAPPSIGELRNRLVKRGTETSDVIEKRVGEAANEMSFAKEYDYIIVNDVLEEAIDDFKSAVRAEELKSRRSVNIINEVLKDA